MKLYRSQLILWCVLIFVHQVNAQNFIKAYGQDFVDSTGTPVFFRGVGLGGWLVPEGYMLQFPGFGSPTSIRNSIIALLGEDDTDEFYRRYEANYVNEIDIQKMAEAGFNSIRLPFNYRMLSPADQPGVYLEEGFVIIDSLISWCKKNGMYVILDMHCAPGGQNQNDHSDSDGIEARLWTETANQSRTVEIWRKIAERYADEPAVLGYDLINEPVLPGGYSAINLRSLYIDITREIREVDSNHIIFIEGNWYATDFTALTPPWDTNMAYSFHKYWGQTTLGTINYLLNIRSNWGVPLWMGESGENSNTWFYEAVRLFEENNVSWCWWTHKKVGTLTSPWSARIDEGYQTVLDYWNNAAPRPTTEFARSALFEMADNLKLDSCEYRPDVVAALLDADYGTNSRPYKELNIPGVIACADYNIGNVGVAYDDNDYIRYETYRPWNNGWQYRNDGVDIEVSQDQDGALYSIGWIETGEWLSYTVNVEKSDSFVVKIRYASATDDGILRISIDGRILDAPVSLPNTGGWYEWKTVSLNPDYISEGQHTLRVDFINSGFNINQIEFVFASNGTNNGESGLPVIFQLGQNYPNPFNGSTFIPFIINAPQANLEISIFDVNGRIVDQYTDLNYSQGPHQFAWDTRNSQDRSIASGVYYYRLKSESEISTKKMIFIR